MDKVIYYNKSRSAWLKGNVECKTCSKYKIKQSKEDSIEVPEKYVHKLTQTMVFVIEPPDKIGNWFPAHTFGKARKGQREFEYRWSDGVIYSQPFRTEDYILVKPKTDKEKQKKNEKKSELEKTRKKVESTTKRKKRETIKKADKLSRDEDLLTNVIPKLTSEKFLQLLDMKSADASLVFTVIKGELQNRITQIWKINGSYQKVFSSRKGKDDVSHSIYLVHGTDVLESVIRKGFDPGKSVRQASGAGVYLSTRPTVSLTYTKGNNFLIVAEVLELHRSPGVEEDTYCTTTHRGNNVCKDHACCTPRFLVYLPKFPSWTS